MKKECIKDNRGFTMTQNKDSVTIRICGEAYRNLKAISDVLNDYGKGWEATPLQLLDYYVMPWAFDQLVPSTYDQSAAGMLLDACRDENDEEREIEIKELQSRFKAAGISTYC